LKLFFFFDCYCHHYFSESEAGKSPRALVSVFLVVVVVVVASQAAMAPLPR
jgi:preprotein translocase subunit Sec61beta